MLRVGPEKVTQQNAPAFTRAIVGFYVEYSASVKLLICCASFALSRDIQGNTVEEIIHVEGFDETISNPAPWQSSHGPNIIGDDHYWHIVKAILVEILDKQRSHHTGRIHIEQNQIGSAKGNLRTRLAEVIRRTHSIAFIMQHQCDELDTEGVVVHHQDSTVDMHRMPSFNG